MSIYKSTLPLSLTVLNSDVSIHLHTLIAVRPSVTIGTRIDWINCAS